MKIFGTEISKGEVLKKIGDITQLGGIKVFIYLGNEIS